MKYIIFMIFWGILFIACSKEEEKPLTPLKKIEVSTDINGVYSGRIPCDNCKIKMIKATLSEDSLLTVAQTIVFAGEKADSMFTDTLNGRFIKTGDDISFVLENIKWNFKRDASGNLTFLTGAGTVYEDENGLKANLIRILQK